MAEKASSKRSAEQIFNKREAEAELDEAAEPEHPQRAGRSDDGERQGISNHPLAEEEAEQNKLPPRGHAKT